MLVNFLIKGTGPMEPRRQNENCLERVARLYEQKPEGGATPTGLGCTLRGGSDG